MFKINKKVVSTALCCFLFLVIIITVNASPFDTLKSSGNTLNLIHISDVHLDTKTKNSSKRMLEYSQDLLKDVITQVNNKKNADVVVFSGDVINKSNKNDLMKFLSEANNFNVPWLYAPGNHDIGILGGISKSEFKSILINKNKAIASGFLNNKSGWYNPDLLYYSYSPKKDFLIIFLDGVIDNKITANGYFPQEELKWLASTLKDNPNKKVIIVQHFPVVEPFKSNSHKVNNDLEYFNVIDKYPNVIAVLSGHYHATKITKRKNVLHISTPALIEYPNAFREIKITKLQNEIKFEINLIETNLKDIQKISQSRSSSTELQLGKEQDRNAVITIQNYK